MNNAPRKYKGITYWVTKTEKGWMNSLQLSTGMVENGYWDDEFAADVDAQDTIAIALDELVYNR